MTANAPGTWKVTITFKSGRTKVLVDVEIRPEPDENGRLVITGANPDGEIVDYVLNENNAESIEWQLYSN